MEGNHLACQTGKGQRGLHRTGCRGRERDSVLLLFTQISRLTKGSPTAGEDLFCAGGVHYDPFEMLAEIRLPADGAKLSQVGLDLAEGGKDLSVCGAEGFGVDGACCHQGGSHIPIAEHHTEVSVVLALRIRDQGLEAIGVEIKDEPVARLSQPGLSPEFEELQVESRTLVGCGHAALLGDGIISIGSGLVPSGLVPPGTAGWDAPPLQALRP
jgi:hypothetical protein